MMLVSELGIEEEFDVDCSLWQPKVEYSGWAANEVK